MELQTNKLKNFKLPISSIIMYAAAAVTAITAISFLVSNVMFYTKLVSQYLAQGYPYDQVAEQLVPSQLFPGICDPIGILGVSFVLVGIGLILQKLSRCSAKSAITEPEVTQSISSSESNDSVDDSIENLNETQPLA